MRNLLVGVILGAVLASGAWLFLTCDCQTDAEAAHSAALERFGAVQEAARLAPPEQATAEEPPVDETPLATEAGSGVVTNYARADVAMEFIDGVFRRSHRLPDTAGGGEFRGLVAAVLAFTRTQDEALAKLGFQPVNCKTFNDVIGDPGEGDSEIVVPFESTLKDSGPGAWRMRTSQAGAFKSHARRIVRWRQYQALKCGACLAVRMELRPAEREVDVTFVYSDRTAAGLTYPSGTIEHTETLP